MGNHEAEILRQPRSRNLDNGHAVQNANNAFQLHFCAYISAVERGRLLEQGVRGGGNNKDAFSVGNLGGVQGFATGQDGSIDVFFGQGCRCGFGACLGHHDVIGVGVHLGNNYLPQLPG